MIRAIPSVLCLLTVCLACGCSSEPPPSREIRVVLTPVSVLDAGGDVQKASFRVSLRDPKTDEVIESRTLELLVGQSVRADINPDRPGGDTMHMERVGLTSNNE